jgi:hypothetical protein
MLADGFGVPLADVYPKDIRIFKVGDDYECRVYCSPYHFEIDIPDMSMQDKQILVEVLSMLFSAGDVFSGMKTNRRKIVILRRAHCLSLAAAIRLRWILETRVCPEGGTGMIWLCAREITGSITIVEDVFVRIRVPTATRESWMSTWSAYPAIAEAYDVFDGRQDRAAALVKWGGACLEKRSYPRLISNCYEDLLVAIIRGCIRAVNAGVKVPPLELALWVRARVYDILGLCQTGIEFLDGYSAAIETMLLNSYCTFPMFKCVITVIASAEPNTSYRNPISLEKILLDITIALWNTTALESKETLDEIESKLPVEVHEPDSSGDLVSAETGVEKNTISGPNTGKKTSTRGVGKGKKRVTAGTGASGDGAEETTKPKPKPRAPRKRTAAAAKPPAENMG